MSVRARVVTFECEVAGCGRPVDSDDDLCRGCGHLVCQHCVRIPLALRFGGEVEDFICGPHDFVHHERLSRAKRRLAAYQKLAGRGAR